ncbi:MAG: LysR family transcriptional regulator [Idiomarina sp.]|nr:LysR family transcriptional regulator [Idiomarina sp.]
MNALRVLATVARTQSFKMAAQELGVTQSAVSRQIQTLETQLGMRVIQRDNRVHDLTPSGRLLAPELQRIFAQLDELTSTIQQSKAADIRCIRVAIHEHSLAHFLAPKIADFASLYPHLELQFVNAPEYLNTSGGKDQSKHWVEALLNDTVDVVVSCGHLQSKQVIAQRLAGLEYIHMGQPQGPMFSVSGSEDLTLVQREQLNYSKLTQVESSAMAMTLAAIHQGQMLMPHYLLPVEQSAKPGVAVSPALQLAPAHGAVGGFHSPSDQALQCFFAKHKERELAVVAFVNWLQHAARPEVNEA